MNSFPARQRARLLAVAGHVAHPTATAAAAPAEVTIAEVEAATSLRMPIGTEELELLSTAQRVFPGGITGNSCAKDIVIARGQGPHVWDRSGNKYLDLAIGSGPMFIGHSHPRVVAAIQAQAAQGVHFFSLNESAVKLASMVVDAVPCAEHVRFANTGTEATMFAIRAARAYRRRDKILKFDCGFHGMHDSVYLNLTQTAPTRPLPLATPDTIGIPTELADQTMVAEFNNLEVTASLLAAHHDELAAVIVEPFQRIVAPAPGFLHGLRELTQKYKIPLIFDEIVTGFRFAMGGAQEVYGVLPDMVLLGKVPSGGLPLSMIAGTREFMGAFDATNFGSDSFGVPGPNPTGNLPQVSTYMGNPLSAAAGVATMEVLKEMTPQDWAAVHARGRRLMAGLDGALRENGIVGAVLGHPTCFDVVFGLPSRATSSADVDTAVYSPQESISGDKPTMLRFNELLLERGVHKADFKYYISTAHTDADIDFAIRVFKDAAAALAATASAQ